MKTPSPYSFQDVVLHHAQQLKNSHHPVQMTIKEGKRHSVKPTWWWLQAHEEDTLGKFRNRHKLGRYILRDDGDGDSDCRVIRFKCAKYGRRSRELRGYDRLLSQHSAVKQKLRFSTNTARHKYKCAQSASTDNRISGCQDNETVRHLQPACLIQECVTASTLRTAIKCHCSYAYTACTATTLDPVDSPQPLSRRVARSDTRSVWTGNRTPVQRSSTP
jgi:hypothetical protein